MKAVKNGRIAFVFYPFRPEIIFIDNMPFAENILLKLAASDANIDVFAWKQHFDHDAVFSKNVRYHYNTYRRSGELRFIELTLRFASCIGYDCVFSVGLIGAYIGGLISAASRCPLVVLNDEFPSLYYSTNKWLPLLRWAARRADAIVAPSDNWCDTLRDELGIGTDKPVVAIRNTPHSQPPVKIDWHTRIGASRDKKIFIHAGTVCDEMQIPEILSSVSHWPSDAILLIHSKSKHAEFNSYRQQIVHLDNPGKVFWSTEPLSKDALQSLISYCTGSFALYRDCWSNIALVGTSSGKLMRSIVCGTPVITSSFDSLNFVAKQGVGVQVRHPAEIPGAIDNLIRNGERYRKQCANFANSESVLRDEAWDRIVKIVAGADNGIDLSSSREGTRWESRHISGPR